MRSEPLARIQSMHIMISAGMMLGSLYFRQPLLTGSILFGFLIGFSNFYLLKKILLGASKKRGSKARLIGLLICKGVVLIAVLGGALVYFDLHLPGLLIGVSTLIPAIIMYALMQRLRMI